MAGRKISPSLFSWCCRRPPSRLVDRIGGITGHRLLHSHYFSSIVPSSFQRRLHLLRRDLSPAIFRRCRTYAPPPVPAKWRARQEAQAVHRRAVPILRRHQPTKCLFVGKGTECHGGAGAENGSSGDDSEILSAVPPVQSRSVLEILVMRQTARLAMGAMSAALLDRQTLSAGR